ncbi:unnamed protein product [Urochloa humidicola]
MPDFGNSSNLVVLQVDNNNIVGHIPINWPKSLQTLQLSFNNLTGIIPASLGNITSLTKLSCVSNSLEDHIPIEFSDLSGLQFLYLAMNRLDGRFPQAILNISTLIGLGLGRNGLSGEIPPNLGNSLPNLEQLELDNNFFHGHIPDSLTNATKLYIIELSNNEFSGVVPSSIGKLTELSHLHLKWNKLQARNRKDWEFMDSLANCTELHTFIMVGNHLEGQLPNSLGNISAQLQYLNFGANRLSGGFPSSIVNFNNLISLGLYDNQFTNAVPDWLGSLQSLQVLFLDNNRFTGFIPSTLSNLSQLVELFLDFNQFVGHIPPSLSKLQMLQVLSISNSKLHGSIPKEIFAIPTIVQVSLYFNNLEGQIPTEVGNAKQLTYLQLSSNKLSSDIPTTLGNCESLQYIELDRNSLNGSIPNSLGNISSLKILNLSRNNLSGSIPVSLGNLKFLTKLDLSWNQLKGEMPTKGIFKNATAVRAEGNQGLCGGILELHLPACLVPSNSTKFNHHTLLKVVIPLTSSLVLLVVVTSALIASWRKHKEKMISLPSFGGKFPIISYLDLARATEDFSESNLIGKGTYGSVYQGKLFDDRNVVAVKVFSLETRGAQKSFITECNTLRNVRHRNLVPIITACSSIDSNGNDFKALIYKFMPRGDLHKLLYSSEDHECSSSLISITLAQRLSIVVDVADAMEYLHHDNSGTVVHCDLKPSNILLDDNLTALVGDFGLARFKVESTSSTLSDSNSTSWTAVRGTIGYIAPECAGGCQISTAADVYSFGVILLEIFIRRKPTDDIFKDGLSIAKFAEINFPDRIFEIVDPQLLQELYPGGQETPELVKEKGVQCLISVLNIGLCCTKSSPSERISMQEVAAKLHGVKDVYLRGC